ncbi:MAG: AMP-binding protein, partial [Planctomycetes bacterium]|nr:AMP-binding protein [Planctomycetota bacterium]
RLFRTAMTDSTGKKISFFTLLVNSILLSKLLKSRCKKEEMIGMILPPSIAGAICNISVQLAGKVPVNLNWTTSEQALKSSISKCNLKTILTSKAVIKRLPFELRTANLELKIEFVDDLVKQIDVLSYASWSFAALLLLTGMLSKLLKSANSLDDPATIIFSSGTTGDPKGVILTNANIISNVLGISEVFTINKDDRILGGLPFFHSFGFTATIWLPLIKGLSVSYHHNPLDAKGVSKAVQKSGSTILAATPTFLQLYMKKCETADFKTLRHVIVGAEKLNPQLAKEFEGKFGIVPREGYGCTELSPVVSINTPDVIDKGIKQIGTRLGTIGRPLPGVAVKVVDPSTFEELGPNTDGMLLVRGANVMRGYLGEPGLTAEVLKEGWYITGDIARVDEDGFITITDRISRFSKIGGEMVPHIKIEEAIQEICKDTEKSVVVTGVPDQQKGERLVVLHTKDFNPSEVIEELRRRGLPPLWIPKPESFRKISEIPLLGTGKVDLQVARQLTKQLLISGR